MEYIIEGLLLNLLPVDIEQNHLNIKMTSIILKGKNANI